MTTSHHSALAQHLHGVARLPHLGVIRAQGEDAAKFLHGQLTQDVVLLGLNDARLAAFCSAKGRMLASFTLYKRSPDDIFLVCSQDILAPTLKRLSMFVLRAKAKLSDASADWAVYGLAGSAVGVSMADGSTAIKTDIGDATRVLLSPAGSVPRALWVVPTGDAPPVGDTLTQDLWLWGSVHSGIAPITAPVVEAYVPQMLNYESVGGVNFQKGCYPGQEVVARSQFRGTLKRRAYLVHGEVHMAAGQEVFHEGDAIQPCGTVASAANSPTGGADAVVSMQVSAASGGALTLGAANGPALALLPLPYPLLDDI